MDTDRSQRDTEEADGERVRERRRQKQWEREIEREVEEFAVFVVDVVAHLAENRKKVAEGKKQKAKKNNRVKKEYRKVH